MASVGFFFPNRRFVKGFHYQAPLLSTQNRAEFSVSEPPCETNETLHVPQKVSEAQLHNADHSSSDYEM